MISRVTSASLATIAVAILGGSGVAQAQTAATIQSETTPPSPGKAADDTSSAGLADIIVTAQRRSENLQHAAIAVTAVGAPDLVRAGVTDATQLTKVAPALQIGNLAGPINLFYIRGVGNLVSNSLTDSAVAVNLDGVNLARTYAASNIYYDLERIEVLKGPQGTLYGKNATGGAINIITAQPKLGEFDGYLTASYGNYDDKELTGAVTVPLGQGSAFRLAGQLVDRDGYYSDGLEDQKSQSVRGTFLTERGDINLTLTADYAHQGGLGGGATVAGLNADDRIGLFDPRAQAIITQGFNGRAGSTLNPLAPDYYNNNSQWGIYAKLDWKTDAGTLTLLPAVRRADLNLRTYAGGAFAYTDREREQQESIEARFASNDTQRLSYLIGGFYMHERNVTNAGYGQQFFAAYVNFLPVTNSYAGFGRLTYRLTERFRLTGGIRYTVDEKKATLGAINAAVVCPGVFVPPPGGPILCPGTPALPDTIAAPSFLFGPGGAAIPAQPFGTSGAIVTVTPNTITPAKTFKKVTYRAGFEYDVAPTSLLYGTFETGFKAGGFFSSIDNPTYQPETIDAFTIGSKNRFLDNRLQLNIELFRWTYKNQQVSHFGTNSQGGVEFVTDNIGRSRYQGVEVSAQARVSSGTTLNASVQYVDAKNLSFVFTNPAIAGPPVTGCAVAGPVNGAYTIDCSGRRPSQAPKWVLSGGVEQRFMIGSNEFVFNLQTRYQTQSFTGIDLLPSTLQKAYTMTDLQLTYNPPGKRLSISGYANNIENSTVISFAQPHPQATNIIVKNLRPPRTYGIRVTGRF